MLKLIVLSIIVKEVNSVIKFIFTKKKYFGEFDRLSKEKCEKMSSVSERI